MDGQVKQNQKAQVSREDRKRSTTMDEKSNKTKMLRFQGETEKDQRPWMVKSNKTKKLRFQGETDKILFLPQSFFFFDASIEKKKESRGKTTIEAGECRSEDSSTKTREMKPLAIAAFMWEEKEKKIHRSETPAARLTSRSNGLRQHQAAREPKWQ
jgi:hypothetical protein